MAATHTTFDAYRKAIADGVAPNLADGSCKVALMGTAYTPNVHTDAFWSTISAHELAAGSGYTAGGIAIGTVTTGLDGTLHFAFFSGDPVAWASFTSSDIRYAVIYHDTGTPATSRLISLIDFGATETITGGTFTLVWAATSAGGIIEFAAA